MRPLETTLEKSMDILNYEAPGARQDGVNSMISNKKRGGKEGKRYNTKGTRNGQDSQERLPDIKETPGANYNTQKLAKIKAMNRSKKESIEREVAQNDYFAAPVAHP